MSPQQNETNCNLVRKTSSKKKLTDYIELRLEDSVDKIPKELQDCQTVVLDGFTNLIELQSFPLKGKPVYFKIYRRGWREATHEFASFLKDEVRQTLGEYNACKGIIFFYMKCVFLGKKYFFFQLFFFGGGHFVCNMLIINVLRY